jgi:predicted XRE-type DNA-binding protein
MVKQRNIGNEIIEGLEQAIGCIQKRKTHASEKVKINRGSGNVFRDLGFPNPEDELAKAGLARQINALIKKQHWNQTAAAKKLKLRQSKISLLSRGQLKNFSLEELMALYKQVMITDLEVTMCDRKS